VGSWVSVQKCGDSRALKLDIYPLGAVLCGIPNRNAELIMARPEPGINLELGLTSGMKLGVTPLDDP
jgi:hypothetical protein